MSYPAHFEVEAPAEVANWRPLVQWLLAVPHLVIANVLSNVANVLALVSWFAILFTGNLPVGIARFQVMALRYNARAVTYAGWLHEDYPPFEFEMLTDDPRTTPTRVDVTPQLTDRNRLTVGLRLLWIIPAALFAAVMVVATVFVMLVAAFAVLFTGRWPEGMRAFVVNTGGVIVRFSAYANLLVDDYPPFSLGDGGAVAGGPAPAAPVPA
jgi:hypothetical protein